MTFRCQLHGIYLSSLGILSLRAPGTMLVSRRSRQKLEFSTLLWQILFHLHSMFMFPKCYVKRFYLICSRLHLYNVFLLRFIWFIYFQEFHCRWPTFRCIDRNVGFISNSNGFFPCFLAHIVHYVDFLKLN